MNIDRVLKSGGVTRFHAAVGIAPQTTAEHQWGVALIVQYINPTASANLLLAALTHDAPELHTGDIPFPLKQEHPLIKLGLDTIEDQWHKKMGTWRFHENLSAHEHHILKVADILEGMHYCVEELRMGHRGALDCYNNWQNAFAKLDTGNGKACDLFIALESELDTLI